MATIKEIDELMKKTAPKELSESWDNDGIMLCGNKDKPVKKVLCALEVRDEVARFAADNGYDVIVTHHPYIFRPISHIDEGNYISLEALINGGISVLSYHTRLDSACKGVNDCLAQLLGLENVACFGGENGCSGRIGSLANEVSASDFGKLLLDKLGCVNIRASLGERPVKKVAVVGGAGKDFFWDAQKAHADAFVTSEIPHHIFIAAKQTGLSLYDCGHYYTENPVVQRLCDLIGKQFPELTVQSYDVKSPYTCIQNQILEDK